MLPLVFDPYLRPQIWGGRALGERFGKRLPDAEQTYGESWEVSGHPHHPSTIAEGEFKGRTLPEVFVERKADILGSANRFAQLPLLIKLLDCQRTLSVQVHPDDATAQQMLGEPNGKTEAWVVLETGPEAVIYAGFKPGVERDELVSRLKDGTVEECLHSFKPKVGDCVFMPAGLVHAVGGGVVMAEVQQASDATFRLYDWNRIDPATGQPRTLHIEEALQAIHFHLPPGKPTTLTPLESPPGVRAERLAECPYFQLDRVWLSGDVSLSLSAGNCTIWMIAEGAVMLEGAGYRRRFTKGETVLIPAACEPVAWRTSTATQLLRIQIP
jgi:mannose-6-phosphate isomerase